MKGDDEGLRLMSFRIRATLTNPESKAEADAKAAADAA